MANSTDTLDPGSTNTLGTQGDGSYLINVTSKQSAFPYTWVGNFISGGYTTMTTSGGVTTPGIMQVASGPTITPSTAIGSLQANLSPAYCVPVGTCTESLTFNVTISGGTAGAFNTGSVVCFSGGFHEQATITNAGVVSGGTQSLTVNVREPHPQGSMLFQGGSSCQFGSFLANQVRPAGGQGPSTTLRYMFEVFGAPDSTHLYVGAFEYGSLVDLPTGNINSTQVGIHIHGMSGSSITFSMTNLQYVFILGQASVLISGADAGGYAGVCTNPIPITSQPDQFSCTNASSTGTGDPLAIITSCSPGVTCSNGYGNTEFQLFQGAEVLDIQDYAAAGATIPPLVDGTFTLEPNNVNWTSAQVEEPHNPIGAYCGICWGLSISSPQAAKSGGYRYNLSGQGINGGTFQNAGAFDALELNNQNLLNTYAGAGGLAIAPGGIRLGGSAFAYGLAMNYAPQYNQPVIYSGAPVSALGVQDPNYTYYLQEALGNEGLFYLTWVPYTNTVSIGSSIGPSGQLSIGTTFNSAIPPCSAMSTGQRMSFGHFCQDEPTLTAYMQNLNAAGSATVSGTASITGATSTGPLTVAGAATVSGLASAGSLAVTGTAATGPLTVTGNESLSGTLTSYGGYATSGIGQPVVYAAVEGSANSSSSASIPCGTTTTCPAGLYRITGYAVTTTAVAGESINYSFLYYDPSSTTTQQTISAGSLSASTVGNKLVLDGIVFYSTGGTNKITYSVTPSGGTGAVWYESFAMERLQ